MYKEIYLELREKTRKQWEISIRKKLNNSKYLRLHWLSMIFFSSSRLWRDSSSSACQSTRLWKYSIQSVYKILSTELVYEKTLFSLLSLSMKILLTFELVNENFNLEYKTSLSWVRLWKGYFLSSAMETIIPFEVICLLIK